jgi:hypothetical protein
LAHLNQLRHECVKIHGSALGHCWAHANLGSASSPALYEASLRQRVQPTTDSDSADAKGLGEFLLAGQRLTISQITNGNLIPH